MTSVAAPVPALSPELMHGLIERAARPDFDAFQAQLRSSGYCARPVRLEGQVEVDDGRGRRRVFSTAGEPDGVLRKACGNRRAAVCAPCAETYRQDAYQLLMAGLVGGKGVPESVVRASDGVRDADGAELRRGPHHPRGRGWPGAGVSAAA